MIYFLLIIFVSLITIESFQIKIRSDEDCFANGIRKLTDKYAVRILFTPNDAYKLDQCIIDIDNAWSNDVKNGFGLFLLQPMDCSTTVTIDCLSSSAIANRSTTPIQYTCHTSFNNHEIACNSIRLTFQRKPIDEEKKILAQLQVTALAKQPCLDKDIFYRCRESYPQSCIDSKLRCNGQSECPRGDDERACHQSPPKRIPPIVIIFLLILAFLLLICVLSTVLICCCCRAAFQSILRRFQNKNEKGNTVLARGEDAGLIKGLNSSNVVEILPEQHLEPTAVVIDSTKPVYPRLE